MSNSPELHALIGVWFNHGRTYYVKRSSKMENYPNTWSLFSVRLDPAGFDPMNNEQVRKLMARMSRERLGGVPVEVLGFADTGTCSNNLIKKRVTLHMYLINFERQPILNPDYYTDGEWLTPEEYAARAKEAPCGLCTRMWSDYSYTHGLSTERFAPMVTETIEELLGNNVR